MIKNSTKYIQEVKEENTFNENAEKLNAELLAV